MICNKCGKELPDYSKFCPFCGAPVDLIGPNDETAPFQPVSDDAPIDTSAFDSALKEDEQERTQIYTPQQEAERTQIYRDINAAVPPAVPPVQPRPRQAQQAAPPQQTVSPQAPRTTYYAPNPEEQLHKKKKSGAGKTVAIVLVSLLVIAGLCVGGYFFVKSRQPDENLTTAQKYMDRGKFEDALTAFQAALADAKDPTDIQTQINLLTDYQQAQKYIDDGDYVQALALLRSLSDRIADPDSALASAVDDLIEQATSKQSEATFNSDIETATQYLNDKKYDQCAAILDSLESDSSLSSDQKSQISKLRDQLTEAQDAAQRQQETQQRQEEQKSSFSSQMTELEKFDEQLSNAPTTEEMLQVTSSSFEGWDTLLTDMYAYLETSLTADEYAAAEKDYQDWIKTRDEAATNAARDVTDETEAQLASMSIKQSYTKSRCYKLLDMT